MSILMKPIQPDVSKKYPEIPLVRNNCETPVSLKRIFKVPAPTNTDDDDDNTF